MECYTSSEMGLFTPLLLSCLRIPLCISPCFPSKDAVSYKCIKESINTVQVGDKSCLEKLKNDTGLVNRKIYVKGYNHYDKESKYSIEVLDDQGFLELSFPVSSGFNL